MQRFHPGSRPRAHELDGLGSAGPRADGLTAPDPAARKAVTRGLAFECAGTAIVVADADMRIVDANAAYAALTGIAPEQLVGTLLPVARPCTDVPASATDRALAAHQGARGRVQCRHRGGQTHTVWMNLTVVTDAAGAVHCHVATFTDIGVLEAEQEALRHWAQHDPLTDLSNRRLFGAELERCISRAQRHAQRFSLLFLDLDRFKAVNDTLGHDAGDALLQELARRLRKAVRAEDLVARWGGDEFIVVLDDLPQPVDVAATVKTLQQVIGHPIEISGYQLKVSASIGVAMFPEDGTTAEGLIRAADKAMYTAKSRGPGRFAFCQPQRAPRGDGPPHRSTTGEGE